VFNRVLLGLANFLSVLLVVFTTKSWYQPISTKYVHLPKLKNQRSADDTALFLSIEVYLHTLTCLGSKQSTLPPF